jgi:hypothetical protein
VSALVLGRPCTALPTLHFSAYWNTEGVVIAHNRHCIDWLFVQSVDDSQAQITSMPPNRHWHHQNVCTRMGTNSWWVSKLMTFIIPPCPFVCHQRSHTSAHLSVSPVHPHTHQSIYSPNHPFMAPPNLPSYLSKSILPSIQTLIRDQYRWQFSNVIRSTDQVSTAITVMLRIR